MEHLSEESETIGISVPFGTKFAWSSNSEEGQISPTTSLRKDGNQNAEGFDAFCSMLAAARLFTSRSEAQTGS